jgi:parallel beta-helix repeat protein
MTYTQTSLATLRSKAGSLLQKIYTEFGLVKTELDALAAAVDTITRSATIVVAASDSSEKSKAQADYVCDGTADDVEIQSAINALPATGGKIQLTEGTFVLNADATFYLNDSKCAFLIQKNNVEFAGTKGTILKFADGINVSDGAENVYLSMMVLDGENISVHDIRFNGNAANITAWMISGIWMGSGTGSYIGMYIDISGNYFEEFDFAMWSDGGSSLFNIHDNMICPITNGRGIALHNSPSKSIVANNIIANATYINQGIFLDSVDGVIVTGNYIQGASVNGIEIYDSVNYCIISNNVIQNGTGRAITMHDKGSEESSINFNVIQGNIFSNITQGIATTAYVRNTSIINNTFYNCTTPMNNMGSNTLIKNNIGYITENTGTATITAPATTVDVTHGLAAAPTRVLLSPTTATAGKQYYVSAKDATTFTITIDSAAEADISFDWQAVI